MIDAIAHPTDPVQLVIADVDGTLLTPGKALSSRTVEAVRHLARAGIRFTITSGRPPRAMKALIDQLRLTECVAAFDGAVLLQPDLTVVRQSFISARVAGRVIEAISDHGLDVWLYTDRDWYVRDPQAPRVAREQSTVNFPPVTTVTFDSLLDRAVKIVASGDDPEAVARCERDIQYALGRFVSAARSQPYYLDVTHPNANKGQVVMALSKLMGIPREHIATIGDQPNDVLMFQKSGVSIAMGNASADVQGAAQVVTTSNEQEGFANAMEQFVLTRPAAII